VVTAEVDDALTSLRLQREMRAALRGQEMPFRLIIHGIRGQFQ